MRTQVYPIQWLNIDSEKNSENESISRYTKARKKSVFIEPTDKKSGDYYKISTLPLLMDEL